MLVAEAHARGLRVVIDWVPNHTSDRHPWFVEARASRTSARRDWYVWADRPNGWRTQFQRDRSAWTYDETSGQWYLHSFLPQQPDLNWDNPEVEAAMHEVLRFWLARGVDGFRIDVVYRLGKDPDLGENQPGRRHDQDWPTIHPRLRAIRALLDGWDERMAVGELYLPTQREIAAYVASGDELHMAHNFFLLAQPWSAEAYRATIAEWQDLLAPARLAGLVPGQPRPQPHRHAPGPGARAGRRDAADHAARDAVHIPGRRAGAARRAHPARSRGRCRWARSPACAAAVGATFSRRAGRGFHHRRAVAADHSRRGAAERDGPGGRSALGARAAPRAAGPAAR